jgi:hypothetical protein
MRPLMVGKIAIVLGVILATRSLAADPSYQLIEEPVYIFVHNDRRGDHLCSIDTHLWVSGPTREWCVRKLEQAAHVARFEMWTISSSSSRATSQQAIRK